MGRLCGAGVAVLLVVALAAALLAPGLGRAPFDDPGEGQHAEIAREMLGGSWLTLRLNGVRYFDKPPLLYWLTAISFSLFGLTEGAARLAPLLGALLAVGATAVLGVRLLGPTGGALAGLALLSCALFAAFARYVRPESLFVAAIAWGFTGLLVAFERRRRPDGNGCPPLGECGGHSWAPASIGCAALGGAALAKDPLGLIGPLVAIALAAGLAGRLRPVREWLPPLGLALLLVIGFGWYAVAAVTEPAFLWYTVVDNHLLNVARMRQFPDEDVPLSAIEFLIAVGFGAFPWILAAAVAVGALVRGRAWRDPAELPWVALALWAVGVLALFTVSPFKLPHYGLPAYPALALLAARAWRDAAPRPRGLIASHLVLFTLAGAGCAWAAAGDGRAFTEAVFGVSDVYSRKEAAWGQASPYPAWSSLQPLVTWAAAVLLAGAAVLAAAAARRSARVGAWAVAAVMLLLAPVVAIGLAVTSSARAVTVMAAEIRARLAPGDLLVLEGPIENAGAVEFYSGHRPVLLDAARSVLGIGSTFADAAGTFWSAPRFAEAWASARPPYLLTTREPGRSIVASLPPESARLLFAHNGRWLYGRAPAGAAAPAAR
ncbi:MAG TPA: glycosyltransferase family 39 protein [Candidatus Acidoferrum sp.]|nr:glycosyltransferase family 39 protein [Candidatus Acidoferrum sp.]